MSAEWRVNSLSLSAHCTLPKAVSLHNSRTNQKQHYARTQCTYIFLFYRLKFHNCKVVSEKRTIMMSAKARVNSLALSVLLMHIAHYQSWFHCTRTNQKQHYARTQCTYIFLFYRLKFHNCKVVSEKRTIMMSAKARVNSLALSVLLMHIAHYQSWFHCTRTNQKQHYARTQCTYIFLFYRLKFHNCKVVSEKRTIMMSAEWRVNSLSLSVFPMHTTEAPLHKAKPGLLKRMFVCMRFTEKKH